MMLRLQIVPLKKHSFPHYHALEKKYIFFLLFFPLGWGWFGGVEWGGGGALVVVDVFNFKMLRFKQFLVYKSTILQQY